MAEHDEEVYYVRRGDETEYLIKVYLSGAGKIYRMTRSNCSCWTDEFKGTRVVTIIDSGNDISIKMETGKLKSMDYSQQRELQILLTFIQSKDTQLDSPLYICKLTTELKV